PPVGSSSTSAGAAPAPVCPNPGAGACLKAGTYKTRLFQPQVIYTVPGGGWANHEDSQVNFTLVPPGVPLSQVENATNTIIVWPGVEAAAMNCSGGPDTKIAYTPKAIAQWLSHHPGLKASPT